MNTEAGVCDSTPDGRALSLAGLATLSAVAFVVLGVDAVLHGPLSKLDVAVADALHARVHEPWMTLAFVFSYLASWQFMFGLGLCVGLILLRRQRYDELRAWAFSLLAVGAVNEGTRFLFDRPRPPMPYMIEPGGSFPSGHAADALLYVGLLLFFSPTLRRRPAAQLAGVLYVLAIGASRIYLAAHFLTDVAAGYCLGGSILLLTVGWLRSRTRCASTVRR